MVKTIVVAETITSGVIGWVDINEFDLSAELLFEGVKADEVIAFDDEVLAYRAVFVSLDVCYGLFTFSSVVLPVGKHFRIEHLIDFVLCEDFVEEISLRFSSSFVCPPSRTQSL